MNVPVPGAGLGISPLAGSSPQGLGPITAAMRSPAFLGSVLVLTLATVLAQSPAPAPQLPTVQQGFDAIVHELRLPGAGLAVVTADQELHRSLHGDVVGDGVLPIASASKWLAVATVLALVDAGALDLDLPVARYLREFDRADKRSITLRQCLANTSGLPSRLPERMRGWDMTKFVAEVADEGLRESGGSSFRYGGVGFQVVAAAAERATGKDWHALFAERIARPLGLRHTQFGTLVPVGGEPGKAALPWVAGGAVSTLDDYVRFLRMLAGKGVFAGERVLTEASVAAMFRDQVAENVEVHAVGFEAGALRYGLGTWIETLPSGGPRVMDPGAFGFTPWLDLDLGVGGVFAVRDRANRVLANLRPVQECVRRAVVSPAVVGTDQVVTLKHGGRERRYLLHLPPKSALAAAAPLLVVLHGGGGNAESAREQTGLAEIGRRAGYVVVFADGTGPLRGKLLTWNSGGIAVHAAEHDVDDVGFLRQVVADVRDRVAIDPGRVYAVGHSNGGMMCHRLAREAPDVFRGIAVVSGAMNFTTVEARLPVAVLLVHGTADEHVRYEGGAPRSSIGRAGDRVDASVQAARDYYVARNGLRNDAHTQRDGKVCIDTYDRAKLEGALATTVVPVRIVTLEGGGHAWPGTSASTRALADKPFPFDAARSIVAFFSELGTGKAPAPAPR